MSETKHYKTDPSDISIILSKVNTAVTFKWQPVTTYLILLLNDVGFCGELNCANTV